MRRPPLQIAVLRSVAEALGDLRESMVFVGGAAVPLLITDEASAEDRPTDDVDVVVEITTLVEYYKLGDRLRSRGFKEDSTQNAPICRWIHGGQKVDVMPVNGDVLGFGNRWFGAVCKTAWAYDVGGFVVRVARAPELLATKAEAFASRGNGDYVISTDMEDFVSIVNGRPELLREVQATSPEVRDYLRSSVATWLGDEPFLDALPGFLAGDEGTQLRAPMILERLRAIGELRAGS